MSWWQFVAERGPELWLRTAEHLVLTGVSTTGAIVVGIPIAIVAYFFSRIRAFLLSGVGILQTIPSLAMLVLLLVLLGQIGTLPALVALTLYALLPIVRNAVAGMEEVAPEVVEAARGVGMTQGQELRLVRLPLAAPMIVAGIRTSAVIGVGIATLSAFIGAGGLGQFINRGLALSDTSLILLGAVPAALLALVVDGSIASIQWATDPKQHRDVPHARRRTALRALAWAFPITLFLVPVAYQAVQRRPTDERSVAICSKNFTEQLILAEMLAQVLEARTDLSVERQFNMGGTMVCHGALVRGEVDAYVEYTGTAMTAILALDTILADPVAAFDTVRAEYDRRFSVDWLGPLGFDNTYVLLTTAARALEGGWEKASDVESVAGDLMVGLTAEFAERPDGYPGFREHYGFAFGFDVDLDPSVLYRAVRTGEVDLAFGFATDGRIEAFDLAPLVDDRNFFPPYEAAPIIRKEVLARHPDVRLALGALAGLVDDTVMRRLNHEVDGNGRPVVEVVEAFLESRNIDRP